MSAQHTPLAHTGCEVHSEDGLLHVAHAVDEPTAARIVQCVNSHDEMLAAIQCAANVLFLLKDEVAALGCHGKNVPGIVRAAIAAATGQKGE